MRRNVNTKAALIGSLAYRRRGKVDERLLEVQERVEQAKVEPRTVDMENTSLDYWNKVLREEFDREAKIEAAASEQRIKPQAFEFDGELRNLNIIWPKHVTPDRVRKKFNAFISRQRRLAEGRFKEEEQADWAVRYSEDDPADGQPETEPEKTASVHAPFGTHEIINDDSAYNRTPDWNAAAERYRRFINAENLRRQRRGQHGDTEEMVRTIDTAISYSKFEDDVRRYVVEVERPDNSERDRTAERREDDIDAMNAGKCPTGTCGPGNRCAAPGLSPKEREHTHAINRDKRARALGARLRPGVAYFMVKLSGKFEPKILNISDVRNLPVVEAEELANRAIRDACDRTRKERLKDARRGHRNRL